MNDHQTIFQSLCLNFFIIKVRENTGIFAKNTSSLQY